MTMRKALKITMIVLMILGITLSILNFVSVDSLALDTKPSPVGGKWIGTEEDDGECTGAPLNC